MFKTLLKKSHENNRGSTSLILVTVFSVITVVTSLWIVQSSRIVTSVSKKSQMESQLMLTAHAIAALLKQDLFTNYGEYTSNGNLKNCPGANTPTVTGFLNVLNRPSPQGLIPRL